MALSYTPTTLGTLNNTSILSQSNANFSAIATALQDGLSRSGNGPNQMTSNLDMDNSQILNLPPPGTMNSPARLVDVASNPTITVPPTGTSGGTVPFLNGNNTWSGTNTYTVVPSIPYTPPGGIQTTINTHLQTTSYVSVTEFGAVGDGSHDDTSAIQAAINAAGNGNGRVLFPACTSTYKVTSPLFIGNGSITGASTLGGVSLIGGGSTSGVQAPSITYEGSTSTLGLITVVGPIDYWGIDSIAFNCNNLISNCIYVQAGSFGRVENIFMENATNAAIRLASLTSAASGNANTQFNYFNNIEIVLPALSTAIGILCDGNSVNNTTNSSLNSFENIQIVFPSSNLGMSGIYCRDTDSNQFHNVAMIGGGTGTVAINLDYSGASGGNWPANNAFFGYDPDGLVGSGIGAAYNNIGTPNSAARPNRFYAINDANSGIYPRIANTVYNPEVINPGLDFVSNPAASTGPSNLTPQPMGQNGVYRISYYLETVTVGSGGTVTASFGWQDSSQVEAFTSSALSLTAKGYVSGSLVVRALGTTNITYATTVASAAGSPAYNLHVRLEKLD